MADDYRGDSIPKKLARFLVWYRAIQHGFDERSVHLAIASRDFGDAYAFVDMGVPGTLIAVEKDKRAFERARDRWRDIEVTNEDVRETFRRRSDIEHAFLDLTHPLSPRLIGIASYAAAKMNVNRGPARIAINMCRGRDRAHPYFDYRNGRETLDRSRDPLDCRTCIAEEKTRLRENGLLDSVFKPSWLSEEMQPAEIRRTIASAMSRGRLLERWINSTLSTWGRRWHELYNGEEVLVVRKRVVKWDELIVYQSHDRDQKGTPFMIASFEVFDHESVDAREPNYNFDPPTKEGRVWFIPKNHDRRIDLLHRLSRGVEGLPRTTFGFLPRQIAAMKAHLTRRRAPRPNPVAPRPNPVVLRDLSHMFFLDEAENLSA